MPRSSPLGPAEAALTTATANGRRAAFGLGLTAQAGRLGTALSLAFLAAGMVMDQEMPMAALIAFPLCLLTAFIAGALSDVVTTRTEQHAADLVLDWFERFTGSAAVTEVTKIAPGDLVGRLTRQPSSAAAAIVSIKNAKAMSAAGMLMALGGMAVFSWQAALLLLVAMPVMVIFFILVGKLTKEKATEQETALQRLSGAFADRIRCLPTLIASDAVDREAAHLAEYLDDHMRRTRSLLRVAFLNSGILDFFSSLSIAILAVFLGLGHLGLADLPGFTGHGLATSLSLLVLAPEVFAPLRRFSEVYHSAAEGAASLAALDPLFEAKSFADPRLPAGHESTRGLRLSHIGRVQDITLPETGLVAIVGPSGAGKTQILRALAGVDASRAGQVFSSRRPQAWISAEAWLPGGRIGAFLGEDGALFSSLGFEEDPRFAQGLDTIIASGGADLSGGQRMRLALGRAATTEDGILFADEPTAKLDRISAQTIRELLSQLSRRRLVIVATHDPVLAHRAVTQVTLSSRTEMIGS